MSNPTRRASGSVLRSHSPTRSFYSSPCSNSFRSASPTRVSLSSVQFAFDHARPSSFNNQTKQKNIQSPSPSPRRMCMCSPTTHPGSFRCSLHKQLHRNAEPQQNSYPSNRLNARRSAMTNSLVRIGTVEGGDLVKRALAALIRPSSHQQRRRTSFQPTPSRLSVMSNA